MNTLYLGNATTVDVSEYLKKSGSLIVPVGCCEQHGPHLPMRTDTIQAEKLAKDASFLVKMMYSPPLEYGITMPCDRGFAGTTSLSFQSLQGFVTDTFEHWNRQGFSDFYIISCHGDRVHLKALESISGEGYTVRVISPYNNIETADVGEKQESPFHACEIETSVMMYLEPRLVKLENAVDSPPPDDMADRMDHLNSSPLENCSGSIGYPSAADALKGKEIYSRMLKAVTSFIAGVSVG